MPGANCSIVDCHSNRRNCSLAIFKVPSGKSDFDVQWRKNLINVVRKDRVMDQSLKKQIENCTVRICEKHFSPSQLNYYNGRTMMRPGAIPTLNLPSKSFPIVEKEARASSISVLQKKAFLPEPKAPPSTFYKSFGEFKERVLKLKLDNWQVRECDDFMCISLCESTHTIPKYEIFVNSNLTYVMRVFGWKMKKSHDIYQSYESSVKNVTLSHLIKRVKEQFVCSGILHPEVVDVLSLQKHCVPRVYDPSEISANPLCETITYRALDCDILIAEGTQCKACKALERKEARSLKRKQEAKNMPAKLNAPVSKTCPERIKATLQSYRLENKRLKTEIEGIREMWKTSSVNVSGI